MKVWGFILAIFIFSLLTSTINEAGLVNPVPEVNDFNSTNISTDAAAIEEVIANDPEGLVESTSNIIKVVSIVADMFNILIKAIGMTVYLMPTLLSYGVPDGLALMFQTIVSFMEGIFLFQVWRRFRIEN